VKYRQVIAYRHYFTDFFEAQPKKVQNKIIKVFDAIEQMERIPGSYLKRIVDSDGLYEIRVQLANSIFRVFCIFDGDKFVILLTGFQKKSQKTPQKELAKAKNIMMEYYKEKENIL
jgi:phage-related protein